MVILFIGLSIYLSIYIYVCIYIHIINTYIYIHVLHNFYGISKPAENAAIMELRQGRRDSLITNESFWFNLLPVYYPSVVYYNHKYFHTIKDITWQNVKQKTDETSNNDCLFPLNIFCWDKWLVSLIKWVQNSSLKHFLGMNEKFEGMMSIPLVQFNAFSSRGFSEWLTLECLKFFTLIWTFW